MAFYSFLMRAWRLIGIALAFVFFAIGATLLGNIYMLYIRLRHADKEDLHIYAQSAIQICFATFVKSLNRLKIIDYSIDGADILQQDQGTLIVANHPSLLDYVLLGSILPQLDCVVKEKLFHNFFCKMVVKSAGYIPNSENPEDLLDNCARCLQKGRNLLIFPEGTRTPLGQTLGKLQRGAAQIAVRTGAPIRIVHIYCKPRILAKHMPWYHVPKEISHFYIEVKELIDIEHLKCQDKPLTKTVRHLNAILNIKLQQ